MSNNTPNGLTISKDGALLNWQGENYIRHDLVPMVDSLEFNPDGTFEGLPDNSVSTENVEAMISALSAVADAASDMQANGNSRALDDPTAETWQQAARMVLDALAAHLPIDGTHV